MPLPKAPNKPATIVLPVETPRADTPRARRPAPIAKLAPEPVARERPAAHLALVEARTRTGTRKPRAVSGKPRLFVLDTNVLMHDPTSLFRFEEHDIFLPMMTLEELDGHKKGLSEVARNARQASRFLDELVTALPNGIEEGMPLTTRSNGAATGRVYLQTDTMTTPLPGNLASGKADNQIIGVALHLSNTQPK